jgi:D-alanyl-D-alanine carboxypeptidase
VDRTLTMTRRIGPATALVAAFALGLTACTPVDATTPPATSGSAVDPGAAPLDPAVQEALEDVIEAGAVSVVIDVRNGDDVTQSGAGIADLGDNRAAHAEDPFRIASVSKAMLATVIMQLVEEGDLTLETTVDQILPDLLESPAPVTVRDLLAHTSGIPEYIPVLAPDPQTAIGNRDRVYSPEELIDAAQTLPWLAEPGTAFNYSNTGYTVLGLLAEEVTGSGVADLVEERIFERADLTASSYPTGDDISEQALHGYLAVDGEYEDLTRYDTSFWSSGASVISTVGDVSSFFQALGSGRLVSAESLALMQDIGVEGYGLGLLAGGDACGVQPPELVFGQRGNGFGYNTLVFGDPAGERVVTLAWTGGSFAPAADPIFPAAAELLAVGLESTCP